LQALGVNGLPDLPTHDQNDACISAVMAAAADAKVAGMSVRGIGSPLARDPDGTLREGPIVIPMLSEELRQSLHKTMRELQAGSEDWNPPADAEKKIRPMPPLESGSPLEKAIALLDGFVRSAKEGDARICTYAWAYRHLFGEPGPKWSQAYAKKVLAVAVNTPVIELPTLGKVGLDSFIVSSGTGIPGDGHWKSATYDREEWERVLGTATVLR